MAFSISVKGLDKVQKRLGVNLSPAIRSATRAIAEEIKDKVAPYPPATAANSPSNRRWYERGYGPRWRVKDGAVHGRKSSQTLGRRWAVGSKGSVGAVVGNPVSYAPFLHAKVRQAKWAGQRQWTTDDDAINQVVKSGAIKRIFAQALTHALGGR